MRNKIFIIFFVFFLMLISFLCGLSTRVLDYLKQKSSFNEIIGTALEESFPSQGKIYWTHALDKDVIDRNFNKQLREKRKEQRGKDLDFYGILKLRDLFETRDTIDFKLVDKKTKEGVLYEYYLGKGLWGHHVSFIVARREELVGKKLPVVFAIHGHGLSADMILEEDKFSPFREKYAEGMMNEGDVDNLLYGAKFVELGYAVVSPVVAFSLWYEEERDVSTFLMAGGYSLHALRMHDFLSIIKFIKTFPDYKNSDMAAVGYSMGGYLALWLAALSPDISTVALSAIFSTFERYALIHDSIEMIPPDILKYADMIDLVLFCLDKNKNVFIQMGVRDRAFKGAVRDLELLSKINNENLQVNVHKGAHRIVGNYFFDFIKQHMPIEKYRKI